MARLILLLSILVASSVYSVAQNDSQLSCPTIDVTGPIGIVQPGEKFVFTGVVEGNLPKNSSFHWEISGGKIADGQGTLGITADADWLKAGTITATLNVAGLPAECAATVSASTLIGGCMPIPTLIDEFGKRAVGDIRTRLKTFFTELEKNPNNQGYVIVYGSNVEMTTRERLIATNVSLRGFDPNRITIVRGGTHPSGTAFTKLYRIPPGTENPTP